jgi:hypothetical protein
MCSMVYVTTLESNLRVHLISTKLLGFDREGRVKLWLYHFMERE